MASQFNTKSLRERSLQQRTGEVFCPRCSSRTTEPEEVCRVCGFSLSLCEDLFPFEPPSLSLVLDPGQILPPGTRKDLLRPYKALRKRIPQVDICFCFVQLQEGCSVEEFSFWLFNTAPDADTSRAWNLLITIDLTSGQLSLTTGYALESFIAHESWEASLQELAACAGDGHWKEGLTGFLRESRDLLSSACTAIHRSGQPLQGPDPRPSSQPTDSTGPKAHASKVSLLSASEESCPSGQEPITTKSLT